MLTAIRARSARDRVDGGKKIGGVKRRILVDSAGSFVAAVVTEAGVQDRAAFPKLLRKAKRLAPNITHVWVDKGYTGAQSPTQPLWPRHH